MQHSNKSWMNWWWIKKKTKGEEENINKEKRWLTCSTQTLVVRIWLRRSCGKKVKKWKNKTNKINTRRRRRRRRRPVQLKWSQMMSKIELNKCWRKIPLRAMVLVAQWWWWWCACLIDNVIRNSWRDAHYATTAASDCVCYFFFLLK